MTPDELHRAVLAALDAAGTALVRSTAPPWRIGNAVDPLTPCNLHTAHHGRGVADGVSWQDAHLIAALRNTAAAACGGARGIIERHVHRTYGPASLWDCAWCDAPDGWPCDDYRDAAAVIPNMPEEVSRALRR